MLLEILQVRLGKERVKLSVLRHINVFRLTVDRQTNGRFKNDSQMLERELQAKRETRRTENVGFERRNAAYCRNVMWLVCRSEDTPA